MIFNKEFRVGKMVAFVPTTSSKLLSKLVSKHLKNKEHINITQSVKIGNNLLLPHPFCIVFGNNVEIGDNCRIYQGVTIGQNRGMYPKLGDNIIVYAGAKIVGNVKIGDNVVIGVNAVVTKDVQDNTVVGGFQQKF